MTKAHNPQTPEFFPDEPVLTEQESKKLDVFSQAAILALNQNRIFGLVEEIDDPFDYVVHSTKSPEGRRDPDQSWAIYRSTLKRMDRKTADATVSAGILETLLDQIAVSTSEDLQPDDNAVHRALKARPDVVKVVSSFIKSTVRTDRPDRVPLYSAYRALFKKAVQSPVGVSNVSRSISALTYAAWYNAVRIPPEQLRRREKFERDYQIAREGSQAYWRKDRLAANAMDNWRS
jgi:hypothetical protein